MRVHGDERNSLDFPDNTFDLIINRVVTWTLPDMFECYREWRRVLAPNGRIVIFDGNHYANLFDENKARTMRMKIRTDMINGAPPLTDHFDFHVRWNYWEERPMIGTPRPEWDRNMLFKLRYVNIITECPVFPDEEYNDSGTSTPMFMIRAEKPSIEEENDYIVNEYWNAIAGCVSGRTVKMIKDGLADDYVKCISSHLTPGSKVLDIGTGSGAVAIPLSKSGFEVTGVDRAFAMIEMAKLTAEENGSKAEFIICDAEHLPFDDGSFDAVVLRNVVWNSFRPKAMLAEAERVLKKGGTLLITDGNWQEDIANWESSHVDSSDFPNCKKRDLGLGAYDVINSYYNRLPLNLEARPDWDSDVLKSDGMEVTVCKPFDDPMITSDLKPILKSGFIVVAKK